MQVWGHPSYGQAFGLWHPWPCAISQLCFTHPLNDQYGRHLVNHQHMTYRFNRFPAKDMDGWIRLDVLFGDAKDGLPFSRSRWVVLLRSAR